MMDFADIAATCCESSDDGCAQAFPAVCSHLCAELVVPYVDECESTLAVLPDETFPPLSISKFVTFSTACRQTMVLYERAVGSESCSGDGGADSTDQLKARVNAVNAACCEEHGMHLFLFLLAIDKLTVLAVC